MRCDRSCHPLFALFAALLIAAPASAQSLALPSAWRDAARALEPYSRTGVIYDRVLPIAHIERLDGSAAAPAIDLPTWRQAYDELQRASLAPQQRTLADIDASARASARDGVIAIAVIDKRFERVRPEALRDGAVRVTESGLQVTGAAPLLESRAVAACALQPRTYRGGDVSFVLDPHAWFGEAGETPRAITIDLADGRGPRAVRLGERVHAHYAESGVRTLRVQFTRADGTQAQSAFTFGVAALTIPDPDDTLHVTATIPYKGTFGTGDAYVYLAPGHSALLNPIVMVEGFDLDNSMNWDELYTLLDQQNLIETLRSDGYDAVVLNFTDATEAIEKNGFVVAALLQQVQNAIAPTQSVALVGASMGGLCTRYALAYLEAHGIPHRVRAWLSFDGPQRGADIPLGLQHWIDFFSSQSASAASFLATLQRPAAREMLLYHYGATSGSTAKPDPMRDSLAASFAAVGDWPHLTHRVAIANGSGTALSQGFNPGAQVIRYDYSNLVVAITGNVWALANQTSQKIFDGKIRILFSTTSKAVTVANTPPWDGAPGGSRASFTELDTTVAPYGDIVALFPSHCFIPTISALALNTTDPFFNVLANADPLALSAFDEIHVPTANQEHVFISPENAAWVRNALEQNLLDAPAPSAHAALSLQAAPNPFAGAARISWALPRAADADLRVYAIDGREVRVLERGAAAAGAHTSTWDGRDARGRIAAPGVYLVRLQSGDGRMTRRVVMLDGPATSR